MNFTNRILDKFKRTNKPCDIGVVVKPFYCRDEFYFEVNKCNKECKECKNIKRRDKQ